MNTCLMPEQFPVTCHTQYVGDGSTFVAIRGYKQDGSAFISEALAKGAKKIVVERDVRLSEELLECIDASGAHIVRVDDARLALAELSARAAEFPDKKLKIIGITGTKGKTTTSFLMAHLLQSAGYQTALLSTVYNRIGSVNFSAPLTTAQPDYLHQFLKLCVDHGITHVVMEVAAQALSLHRVAGIQFDGIIFTNFSQEHAEFYQTMDEYWQAKCRIFSQAKSDVLCLVNHDNEWCKKLIGIPGITSMSLNHDEASYRVRLIKQTPHIVFQVEYMGQSLIFECPTLLGIFNIYNAAMVVIMALRLNIPSNNITEAFHTFAGVPGRLQQYRLPNGATCVIDYAHNPSSFENIFILLRSLTDRLIVVFGAGGDRDRTKRPVMGRLAANYADEVIITSDNPRSEDPLAIAADIMQGISIGCKAQVFCELDREKAIKMAYSKSGPTTIIALLGKGPEEYQIIGTQKMYFSELRVVESLK